MYDEIMKFDDYREIFKKEPYNLMYVFTNMRLNGKKCAVQIYNRQKRLVRIRWYE